MRNAGKVPFKFSFSLIIETVERLAASGSVVLIWERNSSKILSTKPVQVDRNSKKISFGNETLTSEVTLFKHSPADKGFQDKVVKLAIKAGNAEGKTLGKIHLNLADYAEVPSASKRISAELTNGAALTATVQCAFTSMGKAGKGGDSVADDEDTGRDEDDEDFSSPKSIEPGSDDGPSSGSQLKVKAKIGGMGSMMGIGHRRGRDSRGVWNGDGAGGGGGERGETGVGDQASLDKVRKENAKLRKQLEDAERALGKESLLSSENSALKRQVEELKAALMREPEFTDLVTELKEAKMALAILQLERDQLSLQLQLAEKSARLKR